jgi:hypothetical protein
VSREDVVLIKRYIREKLGMPDRELQSSMYYDKKYIRIYSVSHYNEVYGYRDNQLFFIERACGDDYHMFDNMGFDTTYNPMPCISLWKSMGMSPSDVYKALMVDGYSSGLAMNTTYACY